MEHELPQSLMGPIRQLFTTDLRRILPGDPIDDAKELDDRDLTRVVSASTLLASSPRTEDRQLAYEIVTRSLRHQEPPLPSLVKVAGLVLARLGNFPGRKLLVRRYRQSLNGAKGATLLRLEATMRQIENTLHETGDVPRTVTDFQFDALESFRERKSISLSAPTSAGKSFILALHILRKLIATPGWCIVYLVPTRALIRQVIITLRAEFNRAGLEDLPIRCIPNVVPPREAGKGSVYVLTQERLVSLLHSVRETGGLSINSLIVDEAQGIGDAGRGIILHSVIDDVVYAYPHVEVLFASPLAKNPDYLLGLFGRMDEGLPYLERESPVSQNQILVRFGSSHTASFELLRQGVKYALGTRKLGFDGRNSTGLDRRARFAWEVASRDACCLVYSDGAKHAERLARYLAKLSGSSDTVDHEILDFINYLHDHVHPDYGLIAVLRKRIAFHYGSMPGNVRAGVEELSKGGKLRFVCCTSTLLQGINLPARDIVIENPKRGKDQPMQRADFLNLSGRAGRLTREFHGNVWCLQPDNWENPSYEGEPLQSLRSAVEQVVEDGGLAIRKVLTESVGAIDNDASVAAISRIYTDHLSHHNPLDLAKFCPPEKLPEWQWTVNAINAMPTHLPATVYSRNYSILPSRLEDLYLHMMAQESLAELLLFPPRQKGTNGRLFRAMELVDRFLEGNQTQSFRHFYHLAKRWIHDWSLSAIINQQTAYAKGSGEPYDEQDIVYDVIRDLEKDIRYRYAKNLRAYNDVLAEVLRARGQPEQAESLVPFHLFLESGGSNPIYLALVSLGLSRTSAQLLRRRIRFAQNVTPEQCLATLKRVRPRLLELPPFCLREVDLITGRVGS